MAAPDDVMETKESDTKKSRQHSMKTQWWISSTQKRVALFPNNPTVGKACCLYRYGLQNVYKFGHLPILISLLFTYNGLRVKIA
jgi:hypothetical protein